MRQTNITWKYTIGTIFKDSNRDLIILDREVREKQYKSNKTSKGYYIKRQKWYKYKCNNCGWSEGWIQESDLTKGTNCGCCRGFKVIKGINDFGTSHPEKLKFFIDIQEAYTHSINSGEIAHLQCPTCGLKKETTFHNFHKNNFYCSYCQALPNIRPDLTDYFINKSEAWNYTIGNNNPILLQCKDCGFKKLMTIHSLSSDGFFCPRCSDGISYPEKFMMEVLEQLNISYVYQFNSIYQQWCSKYRYDFYLSDINTIIEVHGAQHLEEKNQFVTKHNNKTNKEIFLQIQKNDNIKKELALTNGIEHYIIILAPKSRKEILKTNIIKSLSFLFDLQNINWDKCHEKAQKSLVKKVCEKYNELIIQQQNKPISIIAQQLQISESTVRIYLHRGTEIGWCNYQSIKKLKKRK